LQFPCAGSVFRNPPGDHAGRLVEAAGLKGFRIGDAEISTLHSNFIINLGQAKASDVLALIDHAKKTVMEKFQVALVPEVEIIGEN
jgi:UDP-N-acetylmuramate dehydrogenase